ncbi:ImmA/IrrE family metallo-endopeptidase (plasmid) [Mucilaginibacter robiniae]|uniref:ImmA/IrrE family metallo-endopeptidase n=1 Tax=Mucilaginibacter robiniae TaxID=2728022 RepID=A0A7L5ECB3_9SPHI|nr:ImmA/IrrE family metallo-endopeptidase [Mucilaginibacter robiniae]QJD98573.1 ImmA/IrrE family metallo-endopeptidase [Mucilaginibacter robiniae]
MSVEDLIALISDGLKKPIANEDILSDEINVSYLKRIDKVFNKGLHFYLDPKAPEEAKEASIFFRKENFNSELNLGAKKIVNHFEDFKISLSAIARLADLDTERSIPIFTIKQDPQFVAKQIRNNVYPDFTNDLKEFLKRLISKLAERNVMVFEFVETWNKKEKANIDGFFLKPNVIVIKRNQSSFRREIFTLVHEFGHYLLNEEEVEAVDYSPQSQLSSIERWCNDFAYFFLMGSEAQTIENLDEANAHNDYHHELIKVISEKTNLSRLSLYTRLVFTSKISKANYNRIKAEFDEEHRARERELKLQREAEKLSGVPQRGSTPKPINSPLLISTISTAFHEGVINEYEVCKTLNIKPDELEKYIQ